MKQIYTSNILQTQFPETYQGLFATSEVVVSVPLSIKRIPTGIGSREDNLNLLSKLNLKVYIWYSPKNESNDITVILFDPVKELFISKTIREIYDQDASKIWNLLKEYEITWWIKIIVESSEWYGTWVTGTISAWLAYLIGQITAVKDNKDLHKIALNIQQILKPWSPHQDRIITSLIDWYSLISEQWGEYVWRSSLTKQRWLDYCIIIDGKQIPILKAHAANQRNYMNIDIYEKVWSSDIKQWCIQSYATHSNLLIKACYQYIIE